MKTTAHRLESVQEYYFSRKLREVGQLIQAGHPVINMGIGSPDLAPHPEVIRALEKAMNHPKAHMYQSYQGLPELREAIATFYKKYYQVEVNPDSEVIPLMGSKEGIMHLSLAFLNPGDEVLIPNPGYPTYESVTRLVEATPVFYDLKESNQWQPDFEALEALDTSSVKIMWLNYPNMPTGTPADTKTFDRLIHYARERDIVLINDNPYSFVLTQTPQSILSRPGAMDVTMELNSLSKSFNMAGWRVGMVLGNNEHINAILKVKSNMDSGMFYGIQKGAVEALKCSKLWYVSLNSVYEQRRQLVWKLADALNCTYDKKATGLFVWAKLPRFLKSEEFIDAVLKNNHIFITPGTIFGSNGEGYIRFSLCASAEDLEEAIARI